MDKWTRWTEFLACGIFVLPAVLGFGLDSFEAFAVTLGLMQIVFIFATLGAPAVTLPTKADDDRERRR